MTEAPLVRRLRENPDILVPLFTGYVNTHMERNSWTKVDGKLVPRSDHLTCMLGYFRDDSVPIDERAELLLATCLHCDDLGVKYNDQQNIIIDSFNRLINWGVERKQCNNTSTRRNFTSYINTKLCKRILESYIELLNEELIELSGRHDLELGLQD